MTGKWLQCQFSRIFQKKAIFKDIGRNAFSQLQRFMQLNYILYSLVGKKKYQNKPSSLKIMLSFSQDVGKHQIWDRRGKHKYKNPTTVKPPDQSTQLPGIILQQKLPEILSGKPQKLPHIMSLMIHTNTYHFSSASPPHSSTTTVLHWIKRSIKWVSSPSIFRWVTWHPWAFSWKSRQY